MIHRVLPVVQDFHRKAMFAPHAATIDASGELSGHTLTTDGSTSLSVAQAIEHFESKFSLQAQSREIQAMGIFYHSLGIDGSVERFSLPPANIMDECRTVVALLEHANRKAFQGIYSHAKSRAQAVVEAMVKRDHSLSVGSCVGHQNF